MGNLSLFEDPIPFDREGLASRLRTLADEGVLIGTSSWKYEGWLGQIYSERNYVTRGRFSARRFQDECIAEYAEVFPVVCGDFSFYQFPSEASWKKLFAAAPERLKWAFKAPEQITAKMFPKRARYGSHAGSANGAYLDAALFRSAFLGALSPWRERIAGIVFEFGTFSKACYERVADFAGELERFLEALPGDFRYAVEIRNREFLDAPYFECLSRHGVAHVFNAWTRMPELSAQMAIGDAFTAGFTVTRALLRQGRAYEDAVERFSPYRETREANASAREAIGGLIARARERREPSYIFVNNRLEGNAPATIEAIA